MIHSHPNKIQFTVEIDDVLYSLINKNLHANFFFVEIGTNDGALHDPIYDIVTSNKLHGILIEPVQEYFVELEKNYADVHTVTLINKAIYYYDGTLDMYKVKNKQKLEEWTKGIASINPEYHKKPNTKSEDMEKVTVECISWKHLISAYNIQYIDLLSIDTEGFDFEIIKMIDFDIIQPSIIYFEHFLHCDDSTEYENALKEIINILLTHDYYIYYSQNNCIAYK